MKYEFLEEKGTFCLEQAENISNLYFPIAGENGVKSAVTPNWGGDSKLDQNRFLLEPVSVENLHNNRSSRNFWCHINDKGIWSATGVSAEANANKFTDCQEESRLEAGYMWQKTIRTSKKYQLQSEITMFVPEEKEKSGNCSMEVMWVKITNIGRMQTRLTPVAAVPIYGRSADNIRDHRHVTSLLHRIRTTEYGVEVTPTMSFDERGHRPNNTTYFVCGITAEGKKPVGFYPDVEEFVGEGGNLERPKALVEKREPVKAGSVMAGQEAMGGICFPEVTLELGQKAEYIVLCGITEKSEMIQETIETYCKKGYIGQIFKKTKQKWLNEVPVSYRTGKKEFDQFMNWVSFQPVLRRIYGCSFLPHHDYGKGGRGWRDLWQDCLALLLMNPGEVRQMLWENFGGVRIDGTNATIIGTKRGEFVADRNNITRVWMDHGVWPYLTTSLYLEQTGDYDFLEEEISYFKDKQIARGTKTDEKWVEGEIKQETDSGTIYKGTILEHLLLQNLTAFYEVGEHNELLLRGADWNDALDMAPDRGESVAFTNAYAGNLKGLASDLRYLAKEKGKKQIFLLKEIEGLLKLKKTQFDSIAAKKECLSEYLKLCEHHISGEKKGFDIIEVAEALEQRAEWMMEHIRKQEWVTDEDGNGWFNGYYDNNGRMVEGVFPHGVRMMLTGQVFSAMAGTATKEQVEAIVKSADRYLYKKEMGGYRLNTDFGEVKMDLGRMFGFAYGEKENGAVFSHMAVMYANALYKRGFVKEGYRALVALEEQAMNFSMSHIYPGIPEYFNQKGKGMYHYLTGAASWYMMTVTTEMFGVRGEKGNLRFMPKLLKEQFDENGETEIELPFAGKEWKIRYQNIGKKEYGKYQIYELNVNGKKKEITKGCDYVEFTRDEIRQLGEKNEVKIVLD